VVTGERQDELVVNLFAFQQADAGRDDSRPAPPVALGENALARSHPPVSGHLIILA
jgi:hypothetical protein